MQEKKLAESQRSIEKTKHYITRKDNIRNEVIEQKTKVKLKDNIERTRKMEEQQLMHKKL